MKMKIFVSLCLLCLVALIAIFLADRPPPRSRLALPPTPSNAVLTHVLQARSGEIALSRLVAEKDWETACIIEEEYGPLFIPQLGLDVKVAIPVRPELDEEWKDHLWKIAIVKGRRVAVYYLDNRQIGHLSEVTCIPLNRAMLTYEPGGDRVFVDLVEKDPTVVD